MIKLLDFLERFGRGVENLLLCVLLLGMVGLATWQIFARNLLSSSLPWADEFLKILLLWLAMAGAVAAGRENKHIRIDVLSRWAPERLKAVTEVITALFTMAVCALCAWHGGRFVATEREFGSTLMGNAPAWIFEAAIPVGFGLLAYRYLLIVGRRLMALLTGARSC